MPKFPVVLFDFDHTLFDFEGSKEIAFARVLTNAGFGDGDDVAALKKVFTAGEQPLWRKLEAGELTLETLNDRRFELFVESGMRPAADPAFELDAARMAELYLVELGRCGGLFDGARSLLDALARHCRLALVSNGYSTVMEARLDNFDLRHYFESVVVSDEVGVAKPDVRFFDEAFRRLGQPDNASVLMVGDSLSSDMAGAAAYGLTSCWYNPHGKPAPDSPRLDYVVTDLGEIAPLALGS